MRNWPLTLLVVFGLLPFQSKGQSGYINFQSITTENGLPHNYVHAIEQDQQGFIWVATNYGLARYDGYRFKVFRPDPNNPTSITHKPIGKLFCDSKKQLWMGINSGGINRMDLNTERFKGYTHDSTGKYHLGFEVRAFIEDADSALWLGSSTGLFKYDAGKDAFGYALGGMDPNVNSVYIRNMVDDRRGHLWVLFGDRLAVIDKQTLKIVPWPQFTHVAGAENVAVNNLYTHGDGTVWMCTEHHGLIRYHIDSKQSETFLAQVPFIADIYIDKANRLYAVTNNPNYRLFVSNSINGTYNIFKDYALLSSDYPNRYMKFAEDWMGRIWIVSRLGMVSFTPDSGVLDYSQSPQNGNFNFKEIEELFIDRTDNIWIVPYRKGIYKADLRQKPFYLHSSNVEMTGSDPKNVSSVYFDKSGLLWVGESNEGITCHNPQTGLSYRIVLNISDPITSCLQDSEGYYWFGAYWDRLFRLKLPNLNTLRPGKATTLGHIESFPPVGIRKIVEDNRHHIWLATSTGLTEWERSTGQFVNHSVLHDSLHLERSFYRTVYIDKKQRIWAGSNNGGLCHFDQEKKRFTFFLHQNGNPHSMPDNTVYAIYEREDGKLLVGTGLGLALVDADAQRVETAVVSEELAQNSIFSIFPDKEGNLWMSTDKGIARLNTHTQEVTFYDRSDGLQKNEFNTTASCCDPNGRIYFGGTGGLVSFNPTDIQPNTVLAKPTISRFLLANKPISPGDTVNGRVLFSRRIGETSKVVLNYSESDFTLEFSALHYSAPDKNIYQYRLLGFNSEWATVDATRRWASYTGLPPGTYTFELKASNHDGIMCPESDMARLIIQITPPFWHSATFNLLMAAMLGLLIFLFLRWRTYRLHKQKKVLEETVALRTKELAESNILLKERQEEISSQNENLAEANTLLEERQEEIKAQNDELMMHRNHLESLVSMKTADLENALKKAEESDKLKTSFLANISHEIRTPMNAIIGFSYLLGTATSEQQREEFIQTIHGNCEALLVLIDDIMDVSMIESNQVKIHPQEVELKPVLRDIEAYFKMQCDKPIEIRFDDSAPDITLTTDLHRLKQVMNNLVSNAVKFTDQGHVRFGYSTDHKEVRFYVSDTGPGIQPTDLQKIFDHFFKLDVVAGKLYRGTGIGLSISKNLVQLMGGRIWVESEPGQGSTFYFTLPFAHL